jgi:hypothetical protein
VVEMTVKYLIHSQVLYRWKNPLEAECPRASQGKPFEERWGGQAYRGGDLFNKCFLEKSQDILSLSTLIFLVKYKSPLMSNLDQAHLRLCPNVNFFN